MDFWLILVFSKMPVAIAYLWTDHQKAFKTPIKLLQSSDRRETFLRRERKQQLCQQHITNHIRGSEQRAEGRADTNGTGRIMGTCTDWSL